MIGIVLSMYGSIPASPQASMHVNLVPAKIYAKQVWRSRKMLRELD